MTNRTKATFLVQKQIQARRRGPQLFYFHMLNCNDCFRIKGNILSSYSLFIWWVCSSPFCTVVIYTSVKQGYSELSMWLAVCELIVTHIIWVYSAHGQMLYNAMASETQNLCYLEWPQTIAMDLKAIHMTINERINNAALYWGMVIWPGKLSSVIRLKLWHLWFTLL